VNLKVDVPEHDVVYTIDVGGSGTNGVMLCLSYSFIIATNNVLLPVAQLIGGGGSPGSRDTPFNRICTEDFGTSCHRRPPQGDNLTLRDPLKKILAARLHASPGLWRSRLQFALLLTLFCTIMLCHCITKLLLQFSSKTGLRGLRFQGVFVSGKRFH